MRLVCFVYYLPSFILGESGERNLRINPEKTEKRGEESGGNIKPDISKLLESRKKPEELHDMTMEKGKEARIGHLGHTRKEVPYQWVSEIDNAGRGKEGGGTLRRSPTQEVRQSLQGGNINEGG